MGNSVCRLLFKTALIFDHPNKRNSTRRICLAELDINAVVLRIWSFADGHYNIAKILSRFQLFLHSSDYIRNLRVRLKRKPSFTAKINAKHLVEILIFANSVLLKANFISWVFNDLLLDYSALPLKQLQKLLDGKQWIFKIDFELQFEVRS